MYGIFYLHVVDFDGFHVGKINLPYMDAMGFKMISSFQTRGVNFVSLKITRFFFVSEVRARDVGCKKWQPCLLEQERGGDFGRATLLERCWKC